MKIEKDKIEFIKSHQAELRVSTYGRLMNYLHNRANADGTMRVGKIVILPSTFLGSPRYMLENYHDNSSKKG